MIKQLSFIFFVFCGLLAHAQNEKLEVKLSRDVVSVGQRFQISFSVDASASDFQPPSFTGFRILSGPNQSRRMQYINGQMSASSSWSFILMATEEGIHSIPSATVRTDGGILQSAPIKIRVVQSNGGSSNANPGQNPQQSQSQRAEPSITTNEDVFIRATVDKTKAYVGEEITASYKLYTRVGIAENSLENLPSLNGFWSQDIKSLYDETQWEVEIINGRRYNTAVLISSLLYPQRPGELTVDPIKMKMQIQVAGKGNSLFDRMFGTFDTKEVLVSSNKINIDVKALPEAGKPADFSGAVGEFDMQREFSKTKLKANDALELKIKISGKGNLHLLDAPELELPADFEVYEPEIKDNFTTNRNGISGSRTFEYLIIPRHEGKFTLEPFHFSYFDLSSKSYKTIVSDSVTIDVDASDHTSAQLYTSVNKEKVELLNKDIAYIHQDNLKLRSKNQGFYGRIGFYILLFLPILLFLLLLIYKKKYDKRQTDRAGLRISKAKKIAKKRLATAKKHLSEGDKSSFHEEISAALFGYYSDKFNFTLSELSQEKIISAMIERNAGEELIHQLEETLDEANMARFAPKSDLDDQVLYKKAENVIINSEEELS